LSRSSISRPKATTSRPVVTLGARATMAMNRLRIMVEQLSGSLRTNPVLLVRLVAFILGLILMFGTKNIRERLQRVFGSSWAKIKATAGMGVKVSYI
jgi:hypothetical protein